MTPETWALLNLVNECTDSETNILHLPFTWDERKGRPIGILDQPLWFRQAVKMVREERARDLRERTKKPKEGADG